ncbi:MAG: 1-acyl-sn-glycerol-3-phosphate acyltransferase [Gammaproteobacteria bacterium]
MFSATVTIPTWFFLLLLAAFLYAGVMSVLFPGVRWFFRRRLNKAVDRINTGLQIKIRPLQQTKRQVLIDQLIFDQEVIALIQEMSRTENVPREVLQARVRSYAREIVPSFNAYVYFQVFFWLAKKIARFIYRVRVSAANPAKLRHVDPEATVVFVMNHRSNMDYVLISYLVAERVTLSYAVGEWARVFPLDMLIRAMGAFFVRRGSQNPLYRKVLERYVNMATQSGVCQAVFLEGGLSRDGKLGEPRLGFLDYILRRYDWQTDRNVIFLPASINYDRVLEDQNLLNWDNKSHRDSGWQSVVKLWRFLRLNLFAGSRRRWQRYGYASVNFGIPVSMQDYCRDRSIEFNHLDKEARIARVMALAHELLEALRYVMPVLPVPVIATVMLQAEDESLSSLEILARCDGLIDRMIARGAPMKAEEKPRHKTLSGSLDMLRDRGMLVEENDCFRAASGQQALLAYYANSIAHWAGEPA